MSAPSRRRTRRDRRERRDASTEIRRLPWRTVRNPHPPVQVLGEDQIETIHRASLRVLRDVGMKVLSPKARTLYAGAGASADEDTAMVRFDPGMVEEYVAKAPPSYTVQARNPAKSPTFGGNVINFGLVGGPSFVSDLDRGRRAGDYEDFRNFMKLSYSFDVIHLGGAAPLAPLDLPAATRHLDMYYAAITLHDKVWGASLLGGYRAHDAVEMACIAHGVTRDELPAQPIVSGGINTNSPRQLDANMSDGMIELASVGQPVVVTPFTLLGAMAPTTLAGALTLQNAEALAGMVLCQIVRPGTPVCYGGFTSNVDMKTGAPAFGTPEYAKATQAGAQLARRYRVPFRASSTNASNAVDAQAAYESEMSLWASVMAHTNLVNHAAGWLEGGLTASYEKLVIDAEMCQLLAEYLEPVVVDDDTLALDAIAEVQPGGHFFGATHTLARYEDVFYTPIVSDWRNFETWRESGARSAAERANAIWKRLLAEYEPPPIDPGVDEALREYMIERKRAIEAGEVALEQ